MCTCCNRHSHEHTDESARDPNAKFMNMYLFQLRDSLERRRSFGRLLGRFPFHFSRRSFFDQTERHILSRQCRYGKWLCPTCVQHTLYNVYSYDWFDYDCHQSLICNDTTYSYGEMWINNDLCKLQTICFAKHFFCARWAHCAHWNFLSCRLFGHLTPHAEQSQQFHFAICRAKRCARSAVCKCGCMRSTLCKDIASCLAMVWP